MVGVLFVSEIFNYEKYRASKRYAASPSITHLAKWGALETEKEGLRLLPFSLLHTQSKNPQGRGLRGGIEKIFR